jgi:hypothetical protein
MTEEKYLEYEQIKAKYTDLQERFARVLLEKERLFTRTLPSAIRYDKDKIQSTVDGSPLEDFVVSVDTKEIDIKIKRLRHHLNDWGVLLTVKETALRKSPTIIDRIYVMRYLDGYSVNKICRALHYEKSRIYELLREIDRKSKSGKNRKNYML